LASRETRTRQRIAKALEQDGHVVYTLHGDATSGAGRPDLVVCAWGGFFGMEVKSLDGKPQPHQVRNIRDIRRAGGCAALVHDIEEARRLLREWRAGRKAYMEDELQVLDLSTFLQNLPAVEPEPEVHDPDVIPFPDPPTRMMQPPLLASSSEPVLSATAVAPPPTPPIPSPRPPRQRPSRAKPKPEAAPPAAEGQPNGAVTPEGISSPPTWATPLTGEASLTQIYWQLHGMWDAVNQLEERLREQLLLLEPLLPAEPPLAP
jgi:hypothetical protein